ncbi:MAG: fructosamine kinase family protein [Bacteroidota bacterium]
MEALTMHAAVATPEIRLYKKHEAGELLVMQRLQTGEKTSAALRQFGRQLAQLHQIRVPQFGWEQANYIGKLPQSNTPNSSWSLFYAQERLQPQIRMAVDSRLLPLTDAPSIERIEHVCANLIGNPPASPIHGDLWGGNYMIATNGQAYLIDPSFYHGHGEVDLAMSRLFGGFGAAFYEGYDEIISPEAGAEARRDLYQLYYLLVHLNIFGRSYLSSVQQILNRYFT